MIRQEDRDRYAQNALDRLSVHLRNQLGVTLAGVVEPGEFTIRLDTFDIIPKTGEAKARRALAHLTLLADARQYRIEGGVNPLFPGHEDRYERAYTAFAFTRSGGGLTQRTYRREPDPSGTNLHHARQVRADEVRAGDVVRQIITDRHGDIRWYTVKHVEQHPIWCTHIEFETASGFAWTLPAQRLVTVEDVDA